MSSSYSSEMRLQSLVVLLLFVQVSITYAHNVSYDHRSLIVNGKRRILLSGSVHYPRSTPETWPEIISKAKEGGLDVIESYVFWNRHEPSPGEYYFEGRFDLVKFVKLVQQAGLYMNLRIGPYACAEWNFGGFPIWLRDIPNIVFRTDNEPFKERMQSFLTKIVNMMKEEKLFASQGGPIILAQVENEYGNVDSHYGEAGKRYSIWAAQMAQSQNTGVPWIMCVQHDPPSFIIDTCNGMYCDGWKPNAYYKPIMWTESYTGWLSYYGLPLPHRPTEDIAFAVARFFERGGSFLNYYMYFGGTNFGRNTGGPYVTTSYDYDAPLDEYGMPRLPKWGHLRDLHAVLKLGEEALLSGEVKQIQLGANQEAHVYTSGDNCIAFLANYSPWDEAHVILGNRSYNLPAWSVSILPDCQNVAYNTAKVNSQSAITTMKNVTVNMEWTSFNESVGAWGKEFNAKGLLEQIHTTQDTTDYLWYITSVHATNTTSAAILIESMRDVNHIFVNGNHCGFWHTNKSELYRSLHAPVTLQSGVNTLAILSVTVGIPHFGAFIEKWNAGMNGSLILRGLPSGDQELARGDWTYQVGLEGEDLELFTPEGSHKVKWSTSIPKNKPLTWYKTYFDAPGGNEPVAIDLASMGKGQAWVNGESIGRFWPAYTAINVCPDTCDYRGAYDQDVKCLTGCGQPSQRWYHVPRSWIKPTKNLLVMFEEIGGDPSGIAFVTRSDNSICGRVSESYPPQFSDWTKRMFKPKVDLECPNGQVISKISFASFGTPQGTCGNFHQGTCHLDRTLDIVQEECLGKAQCSLVVSQLGDPCPRVEKSLAVEAACS